MIGLFHTETTLAYSHCAFTGKVLRFPKMMRKFGWRVIDYSNGVSEAEADESVRMLGSEELVRYNSAMADAAQRFPNDINAQLQYAPSIVGKVPSLAPGFWGDVAVIGSPAHSAFEARLYPELQARVKPGDIICHPFGRAHCGLVKAFPQQIHVETGIGYPDAGFGAIRIFETYNWMSYHRGMQRSGHNSYEFVVPNYYDLADWTVRPGQNSGYLLFFGRICGNKGLDTLVDLANTINEPIRLVGQGDPTPYMQRSNWLIALPPVTGRARSELLSGARALLMPTRFHEPFGGAGVEGQLCGTPLISHDGAAFAETVEEGITGYRCHTLDDWATAVHAVKGLDRTRVAAVARAKYSLEVCGQRYDHIFRTLSQLSKGGWYFLRPETRKLYGL